MSHNLKTTMKVTRMRGRNLAPLVIACAIAAATIANAQEKPPATPDAIKVPTGNSAFLVGHARGTQGYICLPTSDGAASWTVAAARPEATLFTTILGQDSEIITHFLSPDANPNSAAPKPLPFGSATWQGAIDSSMVWAKKTGNIAPSAEIHSWPNTGAIDCLLLESIGSLNGPAGGDLLTQTTFIQRLNTKGGLAPTSGCIAASADVGKQVLVPYSADYYFFHRD